MESDPQIFTSLMHNMGVPRSFKFVDIWSLESDQLDNIRIGIQNPIEALILVLPDCPAYAEQKIEHVAPKGDVLWLQQTINNACGLYAILHCICNSLGTEQVGRKLAFPPNGTWYQLKVIEPGSFFDRFMKQNPTDRARYLQNSSELDSIYHSAALNGSSEPPDAEVEMDHHYICLVRPFGSLYELDGDRIGPKYRGDMEVDEDILSEKALEILKMYMNSCPEGGFSLLALLNSSMCELLSFSYIPTLEPS